MAEQPTQVKHPWHATARSTFQFFMGMLVLLPVIINELGFGSTVPWVVSAIAVAAAVTRVMSSPGVVEFLKRWTPWLSPTGKEPTE